jgi:hypothetical protein
VRPPGYCGGIPEQTQVSLLVQRQSLHWLQASLTAAMLVLLHMHVNSSEA